MMEALIVIINKKVRQGDIKLYDVKGTEVLSHLIFVDNVLLVGKAKKTLHCL